MDSYRSRSSAARYSVFALLALFPLALLFMQRSLVKMREERRAAGGGVAVVPGNPVAAVDRRARELLGAEGVVVGFEDLDGDGRLEALAEQVVAPAAAAPEPGPEPERAADGVHVRRVLLLQADIQGQVGVLLDSAAEGFPQPGGGSGLWRASGASPRGLRLEAITLEGQPLDLVVEVAWDATRSAYGWTASGKPEASATAPPEPVVSDEGGGI